MIVELRDLQWAIVAAQHRSLRRAAEVLNIRQSTLSRRLQYIEHRLGAELFERTNGGTRPTMAGQEFLATARRIVEGTDAALTRLKARCRGEGGHLAIGIYSSFSTGNLRATLMDHRQRFPEVEVEAVDAPRSQLLCDLASNALDVVIVPTPWPDWDGRRLSLWSERAIIALPEQHALAAFPAVRWCDLANERLLLPKRDPGPEFERLLAIKLRSSGPPRIVFQAAGSDLLLNLVSAGYGALLVFEGATGAHYEGVVYRELHDDDGPTRVNFTAYWQEGNNNPALRPFLEILRERYPDLSVVAVPG
jgi:DNA-binding transcriptional LysR family regulator